MDFEQFAHGEDMSGCSPHDYCHNDNQGGELRMFHLKPVMQLIPIIVQLQPFTPNHTQLAR